MPKPSLGKELKANIMKQISIFIVEDNEVYAELLKQTLSSNPLYKLEHFSTGELMLEALKNTTPDILILDYYLDSSVRKAMNAMQIMAEIKESNINPNIVLLTSLDDVESAVEALKAGAYDYIVKDRNAIDKLNHSITNLTELMQLKHELEKKKAGMQYRLLFIMALLASIALTTMLILNAT